MMTLKTTWAAFRTERTTAHLIVLGLIIAVGIGLRIALAAQTPILGDESQTYFSYVSQPWWTTISLYDQPNNHIFHSVLAKLSITLLGDRLWVLRIPVMLTSIAIIPLTYWAFTRFYTNEAIALLAAAFVAATPNLVAGATTARGYPIAGSLFLLNLIVAHQLTTQWNAKLLGVFALLGALQMYTFPSALYAIGIPVLWVFITLIVNKQLTPQRFRDFALTGVAMVALTMLLYTPVFLDRGIAGAIQTVAGYSDPPQPLTQLPNVFYYAAWKILGSGIRDIYPAIVGWPLVIAIAASFPLHWQTSTDKIPLHIPIALWTGLILLGQRSVPFNRVWIFLYPVLYGLAAVAIIWLITRITKSQIPALILASAVCLSLAAFTLSKRANADGGVWAYFRVYEFTDDMAETLQESDIIVDLGSITPLPHYYHLQERGLDPTFQFNDPDIDLASADRLFLIIPIEDDQAPPVDEALTIEPLRAQYHFTAFTQTPAFEAYSQRSLFESYGNFAVYLLETP